MNSGEVASIRAASEAAMRDTCKIGVRGAPLSDDPADVVYTYGAAVRCGYQARTSGEAQGQATKTDGVLRIPWGTSVSSGDRIKLTHQAGIAITERVFAVEGARYGNLANHLVKLVEITGAADR